MPAVHHSAIATSNLEASLRFWRDGLGLTTFMDHTFRGDWRTLFGAPDDELHSVFLSDPQHPDCGLLELVVFASALAAAPTADAPRHGFLLLSLERDVDATLQKLSDLGFTDGVRRISMPAPGGKSVAMAVIRAPDGVLVELIGSPT